MSDEKQKSNTKLSPRLAIPFFVVMGVLTVCSFLIPLRPTVSYSEKRELAKFPAFSVETLISGEYFDDITIWFSDTFPGRVRKLFRSLPDTDLFGNLRHRLSEVQPVYHL